MIRQRHARNITIYQTHGDKLVFQREGRGIYLNDSSLSDHTERCVCRTIRVFLYSNDLKVECALELRVCHMSFGESQPCRANKTLILGRFSCKTWSYKCGLSNHSLPLLGCKRKPKTLRSFLG